MKANIPRGRALVLADQFMQLIRPACERIEIAGSLRRQKTEVGDIEIVCIPKPSTDLFGSPLRSDLAISEILTSHGYKLLKNGEHYKQVNLGDSCLDLFLTTKEQWGCIFLIRTGSAEFSKWLVTRRSVGGGCPTGMYFKDGHLWRNGVSMETLEECDVFEALGVCYVPPENREKTEGRGS
ncbi:MAG: hypothetical protein PHQ40_00465 [Anaerolineaceae bacterium]|nr:hypothetical protein [Anaerolineaceae bacterium]MDD5367529.1 hypothetical protein [Anaerolineaceae bacterium]